MCQSDVIEISTDVRRSPIAELRIGHVRRQPEVGVDQVVSNDKQIGCVVDQCRVVVEAVDRVAVIVLRPSGAVNVLPPRVAVVVLDPATLCRRPW